MSIFDSIFKLDISSFLQSFTGDIKTIGVFGILGFFLLCFLVIYIRALLPDGTQSNRKKDDSFLPTKYNHSNKPPFMFNFFYKCNFNNGASPGNANYTQSLPSDDILELPSDDDS